jgi:hypothetical protein
MLTIEIPVILIPCRIYSRLAELGYTNKDYPERWRTHEWNTIINKGEELTDKGRLNYSASVRRVFLYPFMAVWDAIRPKLIKIIDQKKTQESSADSLIRRKERGAQTRSFYLTTFPALEGWVRPEMGLRSPSIQAMLAEDTPVIQERWDTVKDAAETELLNLNRRIEKMVVHLAISEDEPGYYHMYIANSLQPADPVIFTPFDESEDAAAASAAISLASTVVLCDKCNIPIFGARAASHSHDCKDSTTLAWKRIDKSGPVARDILAALGMDEDATADDVEPLDFVCKCGHPDVKLSMTFPQLVRLRIADLPTPVLMMDLSR